MKPIPIPHHCQLSTTPRLKKEYGECQCKNKSALIKCKLWDLMSQQEKDEASIVYRAVIVPSYPPYTQPSKEDLEKSEIITARHRKELGYE